MLWSSVHVLTLSRPMATISAESAPMHSPSSYSHKSQPSYSHSNRAKQVETCAGSGMPRLFRLALSLLYIGRPQPLGRCTPPVDWVTKSPLGSTLLLRHIA